MKKEHTAHKKELIVRLIISFIGMILVGIFVWSHGLSMHIASFEVFIIAFIFFGVTIILAIRKLLKSEDLDGV